MSESSVAADAGHGEASTRGQDYAVGPQGVQDDAALLRHLLQPGEVPGARAEGSLRQRQGGLTVDETSVFVAFIQTSTRADIPCRKSPSNQTPVLQDVDEPEMSDWERYAAEEYEILVAEEGANELNGDDM